MTKPITLDLKAHQIFQCFSVSQLQTNSRRALASQKRTSPVPRSGTRSRRSLENYRLNLNPARNPIAVPIVLAFRQHGKLDVIVLFAPNVDCFHEAIIACISRREQAGSHCTLLPIPLKSPRRSPKYSYLSTDTNTSRPCCSPRARWSLWVISASIGSPPAVRSDTRTTARADHMLHTGAEHVGPGCWACSFTACGRT